jgi:ATP-binding cassette subfamily B protein/ATP-binding cassette subfamily C protein
MIKKINNLLTYSDKKKLVILFFMSLFLSLVETIGIAAIMPFISMASNPELILENKYYNFIYNIYNFNSTNRFIIFFGFGLILFYMLRAFYIVYYTYAVNKFSMNKYTSFVKQIFKNYLNMPYSIFVLQNIGMLSKVLTSEAYQLSFVIQNLLILVSEFFVIFLLYILMIYVNLKMTLLLTFILIIKILFLKITISKRIVKIGEKREQYQGDMYRIINETFGNFKIIKFISNQFNLVNNFKSISKNYGDVFVHSTTLQTIPRNVLEATGFSMLIGAVIYIVAYSGDIASLIPIISMYALALYRILPAITKILNSYNNILFHSKSLDIVYNECNIKYSIENENKLLFKDNIKVKTLNFSYNSKINIINNLNLKINKGQKIAFIGESGSGKSTLVDLICGIYRPNSGKIFIDNVELDNSNIVSWRKKIGYIPQSIYLFDGTIADNVSFGRDYDKDKIIKVLKQANIYDTLIQKDGLDTMVGEGGIQLSGGQKQRIGIARALYGDPEILVLDEATSALDTDTEKAIMDEIYKVSEDKTLMIIAHRLSTIEKCDIKIDIGKLNEK